MLYALTARLLTASRRVAIGVRCGPTFWSLFLSRAARSSSLDSGEPFYGLPATAITAVMAAEPPGRGLHGPRQAMRRQSCPPKAMALTASLVSC